MHAVFSYNALPFKTHFFYLSPSMNPWACVHDCLECRGQVCCGVSVFPFDYEFCTNGRDSVACDHRKSVQTAGILW